MKRRGCVCKDGEMLKKRDIYGLLAGIVIYYMYLLYYLDSYE